MPTYEYECLNCGHEFEERQRMTDEPLTICPKCDQKTLRKLISRSDFHLKGEGWYETDFKSKK